MTSIRCPRCRRRWPSSLSTCPDDGTHLHVRPAEVFSENVVTERRAQTPFDEHHTAMDPDGLRGVGDTPSSPAAVVGDSSGEITAQTARAIESAPPPTAQPPSDPTTATRLAPGFVHLVPGTLVGEYVIEKLLGSGGMGAVYGGRHERLGKRVAVKVIAPALSADTDAVERFDQEALALARFAHPNVVNVLSVGTIPGDHRSFYVMEWLDGLSLEARLARDRVPLDDALDVVDQIARGLEAAHAAGIVHRDLKPANVWLQHVETEARPIVKLLDFGLAKLREHRRTEHTATNVMFGTPQYISPEQCRSARDVGPATDVYALGCVTFKLLTGRLPFTHDNMPELIVAHQTEEPPHPRDVDLAIDPRLDELTFAMLAKDPARRRTLAVVRSTIAGARRRAASARGAPILHVSTSTRTSQRVVADPPTSTRRWRRGGVILASTAALVLLSFLIASRVMRSDRGDVRVAPTLVPVDATETIVGRPRPVDAAVGVDERAGDQLPGDTTATAPRPARRREALPPPPVPDVAREHTDAGTPIAVSVDAAVRVTREVDAGQRDEETQASPSGATAETKSPSTERNLKPPPVDRKPQRAVDRMTEPPRARNTERDRTWNPFKKDPR